MTEPLEHLARELVSRHMDGGGCGWCGGLPHTDTCLVGRTDAALKAQPQGGAEGAALVAAVQPLIDAIQAWEDDDRQGYDVALDLLERIGRELSAVVARLAGGPQREGDA